jgi:hypothetical protein
MGDILTILPPNLNRVINSHTDTIA